MRLTYSNPLLTLCRHPRRPAVSYIPPNLESKLQVPQLSGSISPTFEVLPLLASFSIHPFSLLLFLLTPLSYALSPFPSALPTPPLVVQGVDRRVKSGGEVLLMVQIKTSAL